MQRSGKTCEMEFSVSCPGSGRVLRAEPLQPAPLASSPGSSEPREPKSYCEAPLSFIPSIAGASEPELLEQPIGCPLRQQTTASCYRRDLQCFDSVKQTWLLLYSKYALQLDPDDPWWPTTPVRHLRFTVLYWLSVNFLKVWCLVPHCIGVLRGISILHT